ncbi:MAG: hypothetical protein IKZ41_08695, partial [Clostridia bacterium]|nr:hypothetical protein [Clostridia bacterium]
MKKVFLLLSAVLLIALLAIPAFAEFDLEDFTIPDTGVHFAFNGDAKDEFGNVTGELVGEPTFVEGRDGTANGAVYLDDDTQYIFIGKYVDADSYTAIFWCKVEENTEHVFLCSSILGSIRIIHDDATHVGSTINGVVDNISDYAAPRDEWVMLAFVYANENMDIYANGEYQTSLAGALPLPFTLIGNEAAEQKGWQKYPFLTLDDAWFYGRAFTADEVKTMYLETGGTASASSGSLTEILAYDYKECGDNTNEELQYNHEDPDIKTALSLKPLDGVDPEGTWYDFDISVAGEGDVEFTFLYAAKDDRYMDVTFNGETKQVTCANTGNFQTFDQVSVTFSGVPAGTQTLRIAAPSDYSDSHKTPNIDIIWYGAPGAGAATSSDAPDYVTDGLAAWYDGANNAAGSQDKGATVWKDASGHGLDFEVELNDTNYWTDKAFHIDST